MIPKTIIEYDNMILEVIRGYWKSKQVKKRSKLKNATRDAVFCIYTHMIHPNIIDNVILTLNVIRSHCRSLGEDTVGQNRSKRAKNLKIYLGMQFFAYIPIQYP